MKATRLPNKLMVIGMATVLLLPYTAPGVCGLLGRTAGETEMSNDVTADAVQSLAARDMCCAVEACGIPHVAPPGSPVILVAAIGDARADLPAPPSADPTTSRLLLTPPPKA